MSEGIIDVRYSIRNSISWLDEAIDWLSPDEVTDGTLYPETRARLCAIREMLEKAECDQFKRDCDAADIEQSEMEDRMDGMSY